MRPVIPFAVCECVCVTVGLPLGRSHCDRLNFILFFKISNVYCSFFVFSGYPIYFSGLGSFLFNKQNSKFTVRIIHNALIILPND